MSSPPHPTTTTTQTKTKKRRRKPPQKASTWRVFKMLQQRFRPSWSWPCIVLALLTLNWYLDSRGGLDYGGPKGGFKRPLAAATGGGINGGVGKEGKETEKTGTGFSWHERKEKYPVQKYMQLPKGRKSKRPKIQHDFSSSEKKKSSSHEEVQQRQNKEHLAAVKFAFQRSWKGYRNHAWGKDELMPMSGDSRNNRGGWSVTLIDSLPTLWIMGLKAEFEEAVKGAAKVNFTRSMLGDVELFGSTARVLGGLLSAYDLSGGRYPVLLEKAVELGDFLYGAFDTPNRLPVSRWSWKRTQANITQEAFDDMLLAELPALTIEFTRLTQLSGDPKFYDAVQRVTNLLEEHQDQTKLPGLWPLTINAKDEKFDGHAAFTLGWMADSAYSYLPSQHLLLPSLTPQLSKMYQKVLSTALTHNIFTPMLPSPPSSSPSSTSNPILLSSMARLTSNAENTTILDGQIQHLSCYLGGTIALASRAFSLPEHLGISKRLVDGCIWAHEVFPNGIMPEAFYVVPCQSKRVIGGGNGGYVSASSENKDDDEEKEEEDVQEQEEKGKKERCAWDERRWLQGVMGMDESITSQNVFQSVKEMGLPRGITSVTDKRYTLSHQHISSLFTLYRLTGDSTLRTKAWTLFSRIERLTRTQHGNASLRDVVVVTDDTTNHHPATTTKVDTMESFWTGATLRYFYLMFTEESVLSLDDWVWTGEGHVLRRPR